MNNEYIQSLSVACTHLKKRVPRSAQNLGVLFDTFELISDQNRVHTPLVQSCLEAPEFVHRPDFPSMTEDISKFLTVFLETSRSILVCSLMDPFFTGDFPFKKSKFVSAYMSANGAAQWYIDNVLTPDIRELLPNGEILFRHLKFHPYRALKNSFESDEQALNYYIQFFSSQRVSKRWGSMESAFQDEYSLIRTIRRQEASTLNFNDFRQLFKSFYNVPNLPSLKQASCSSLSFNQWVIDFVLLLKKEKLKIKKSDRLRIKLRRSLQSRALLHNELLLCLESPLLILPKPEIRSSLFDQLEGWGKRLDDLLAMMTSNAPVSVIEKELHLSDVFYENEVRLFFEKFRIVIGDRPKNSKQIKELISKILESIDLNFSKNTHELEDIFKLVRNFQNGKISRSTFLNSPQVARVWGSDLSAVSPLEKCYQDIATR